MGDDAAEERVAFSQHGQRTEVVNSEQIKREVVALLIGSG